MRDIILIFVFGLFLTGCREPNKQNLPESLRPDTESKDFLSSIKIISSKGECYLIRGGVTRRLGVSENIRIFDIIGTHRGRIHLRLENTDFFVGEHSELFFDLSDKHNPGSVITEIVSGKLGIKTDEKAYRIRIGKNILQTEKGIYTVLRSDSLQIHIWKGSLDFFRENKSPIHSDEGSYIQFTDEDYSIKNLDRLASAKKLRIASVFKIQKSKEIYKDLYDMFDFPKQEKKTEKAGKKLKIMEADPDEAEEEKIDLSRYIPLKRDDTFRNNHLKIDGL